MNAEPIMKLRPRQRGIAAVELGLLLAPLVLLAFGITEFGRAAQDYSKIVKSARDGARYLTLRAPGDAASIAAAKNLVVYGSTASTGTPLVTGLSTSNVTVADSSSDPSLRTQPTGNGTVNLVKVSVTGVKFTSLVPAVVSSLTFGPITVTMGQVL